MSGQAVVTGNLGEVIGIIRPERRPLIQIQSMLRHQLVQADFHMPLYL